MRNFYLMALLFILATTSYSYADTTNPVRPNWIAAPNINDTPHIYFVSPGNTDGQMNVIGKTTPFTQTPNPAIYPPGAPAPTIVDPSGNRSYNPY